MRSDQVADSYLRLLVTMNSIKNFAREDLLQPISFSSTEWAILSRLSYLLVLRLAHFVCQSDSKLRTSNVELILQDCQQHCQF